METNLPQLVKKGIVSITSLIHKCLNTRAISYFSFYRAAIWFIISSLLLLSAPTALAQDVLLGFTSQEGPQGGGTAFTINSSGSNFTLRKGFYNLGISPFGDLTLGKDGNFYGMTANRGKFDYGTIFKMTPAGKVTNLHHFNQADGTNPAGNLIQATDGHFYGMTFVNGEYGKGTIFKISPEGVFKVLKSFDASVDGSSPWGSLVQGKDGNFYGMTWLGGKYNYGTIFKMTPAGEYTVLRSFNGTSNGGSPYGNLVQGNDGNFYGMTYTGGTYGNGTIFKVTSTGTFTVLRSLNGGSDGSIPGGSLLLSTDGNFYGMTYAGGENYYGTIFKITPKGAFKVLHSFNYEDSSKPNGSLVRGSDGNFYGMTSDGGSYEDGTIFKLTPGGTFTVLKHLDYFVTGANPRGSLVQGKDGGFYGMAGTSGPSGYGTIFKITPGGTFTLLISLPDNSEGNTPYSSLVQGRDGYYYGTTTMGGKYGGGTIFKMCLDGTFTILHSLNYNTDGANPESALIQGSDGNFYGTARTGGSNGYGTIYKITPRGTFSVLHSFDFNTNGMYPHGGLVQGNDNNFYGLTFQGGKDGGGTIYKITPAGKLTTLRELSFADGVDSKATLVKGKDGNFYGMTHLGGNAGGTIFKITPTGTFSVIYNFTNASGGFPRGSLSQDANGNFYGATHSGGSKGYGTIFKITSSGTLNVLYNFDGTTDGQEPQGSLVRDSKGNLYGMNSKGGNYQGGTIFRLTAGGAFTVLRHLNPATDGGAPQGSLIIQKANPVAKSQSVVTALNTPKAVTLSGTGGTPLTYTIVTQPKNGTLSGSGANRTYKPNPGFSGTDSFTFRVNWGCQASAAKTITITVGNITASTIRINSGGEAISTLLGNFQADDYFVGNTSISTTASFIVGTTDDALYQNTRKAAVSGGSFNYKIPVTNGTYLVKLHFAEIAFSASGKRQFNVAAEDASWLKNYDIFVAAGGANKAVVATKSITVNDGELNLSFTSVIDKACVAALEVVPASQTARLAEPGAPANQLIGVASLYPNPVTDNVVISWHEPVSEITAIIINAAGAEVKNQNYSELQNNQLKLDVRSLTPGAYLLRIQTDKGQQNFKFIKQQ